MSCMLSKLTGSDHVRDREKMVNIKIINIFSLTDLVFLSSFYNACLLFEPYGFEPDTPRTVVVRMCRSQRLVFRGRNCHLPHF